MGEQADLLLNGDCCEVCGENFDDEGSGYPRRCSACRRGNKLGSEINEYEMMEQERRDRREGLEPSRIQYAMKKLGELNVKKSIVAGGDQICIEFSGNRVDFWPYTGWFCGRKPIGNIKGRGIAKLIGHLKILTNAMPASLPDDQRGSMQQVPGAGQCFYTGD